MNTRIRKKHQQLGTKRAGAWYCADEIARHIGRKVLYAGITFKPSYRRNIRSYVHWFFLHSSEKEWSERVVKASYTAQMFFSAKHLLPPR